MKRAGLFAVVALLVSMFARAELSQDWETLATDAAASQTFMLGMMPAPWKLEVVFSGLKGYDALSIKDNYPQLVGISDGANAVCLSVNGYGNSRDLFLTGAKTGTQTGTPVGSVNGNNDVGNGELWAPTNGVITILLENDGRQLSVSQNGHLFIKTDKNTSGGMLTSVTLGGDLSQLGGGKIASARIKASIGEIVHPAGYGKLVFDEEFGGDALDATRWEKVPVMKSGAPNWRQYTSHREDLVAVSNGCLVLTGVLNDKSDGDQRKFLCGQVQSSGKFSFKYGVVEIRAKFEDQDGAWPAMWMMPQNAVHGGWPRSGEIDITERLNADAKVYQTAHFGEKDTTSGATAAIVNGQFNVYRLEWTEQKITWYVNGAVTHSYSNDGSGYLRWPFDSPFYLILSQQLEGSWVGTVDDTSTLPVRMYVDYVRVWQKDEEDVRQNAYLWLDAADASTVETNAAGEVTAWHSANICGKTAGQYALASESPSGPTMIDCQLPSANYQLASFGDTAANRDLKFERTAGLRTVFMVAKAEQGGNAFLLGDGTSYDFHRGSNGEYWGGNTAAAIRGGETKWNGVRVADPAAEMMPSELGLIEVYATDGVAASQLCYDRTGNGAVARRGGKDIAELIAFEDALGYTDRLKVRKYLMDKWLADVAHPEWTITDDWVLRQTGDFSGGLSVSDAFADGAGTYEFGNLTLVGAGGNGGYTIRVREGDTATLRHGSFADGRSSVSLDVRGGTVYLGAADNAAVWYGDNTTTFKMSGGTVVVRATGTAQTGSDNGFLIGWSGGLRGFDVSGGLLDASRSSLNFWSATTTVNVSGAGTVRAKGIFAGQSPGVVNLNGGTLEIGSLGVAANACTLNLGGGTLKGFEPGAAVHGAVGLSAASKLASADGASLTLDGSLSGGASVTLAAGSTLTLPSDGALTFGLKTDCAGVKVTDGVLDFGTVRGAELTALSGTGTIRISLTDAERKTAGDEPIKVFAYSGANYAGDVTVVSDVGGASKLALDDGFLVFSPSVSTVTATVSGTADWSALVWKDDFGKVVDNSVVTGLTARIVAKEGAAIRIAGGDNLSSLAMSVEGTLTVVGDGLTYLPWSGTEVGGTIIYAGTYDLGAGIAGFSASGTYEFATNCTITANKFMTGNTYDVVQTFRQLGGRVTVTNAQDGTATGSAPSIFAHWGSGRPSTVTYDLLGGEFVATNSTRYALYFGADGKPTLNVGGGDGPALMELSGLAQGTDGTARTQPGAVSVRPNGTLRIGAGGIYLRNDNTAFTLAGGTLAFAEGCSVSVAHSGRVNLTADSTVSVPTGKVVAFAHPWTGDGKLSLVGGGQVSLEFGISSKNVHDGIAVGVAKVADDFPTDRCHVYFTCEEYDGIREAAKLEVADGVLMATPQVDETVWVQTDITGNSGGQLTAFQTQSSFYRGKSEFQPLIGLRVDQLPQNKVLRSISAALSAGTPAAAISDVKLYRTTTPYFANAEEIWKSTMSKTIPSEANRNIVIDYWSSSKTQANLPTVTVGDYLWICVRVPASAPAHAELDAHITSWVSDGMYGNVSNADPKGAGEVYPYAFHIVPYWRLNGWTLSALTRQHFACYTEIIPFYITVGANGSVGHGWNGEQFTDAKFQAAIDRIKALRAGKDVKLLVGVGCSQGTLPTVCANETLRKAAAQNLAAFVRKFGLDGVDFDWEYPTAKAHWEGWCNLVADLKPLLFRQGGGKLVSVAVTGWRTQQGGGDLGAGAAVKGLYQQCDFVNMMSYDGGEAAGHSTLALMNNDFTRAANYGGIPNYKICGGQAFYTNHYPCDGSQNGYNWVVNNYPQYVDSTDKFTGSDGKIYTYNSIATIKAKTARCKELGGGAMIWANETDTALSHAKSATRAMFSQLWPTRPANDGALTVEQAADWPAIVSAGAVTLADDITLDAGILRPAVFSGTLDGGGHAITVSDDAPAITANTGKFKNVTVRYANGIIMGYDANGNAFRGCDYPNAGEAPALTAPYGVDFTASQLVTVGAMVNIPDGYDGDVVNLVDGSYRIWLRAVPNGAGFATLKLGWTDKDGKTLTYRDGGALVTTGPHAVSVTCSATKYQGTRVYVDGELTATDGTLNFSSASFSKVYFGSAGMGLYACDAVSGCRGAFAYPFSASYPAFNVIGIHADDDPLELTDLAAYASNVTATVFASVKSPDGAFGPVVDFTVRQGGNTFVVEANRADATTSKLAWRYLGSDSRTYAAQTVTARETAGNRVWHMSYDAAGGTYLDVNGKSAASSTATKWSKSMVNGMAVGLRAGMEVGERKWLPGRAAAASASDPLGGLVTTPDWYGEVNAAVQDYLYEKLGGDIATYEIPEITVNGKAADANAALLAMRFFGGNPSEARDYSLALDAPVVSSDKVTLGLHGDQPVNAALQLRMRETLDDAWRIAAELPARSAARTFSFPFDVGGKFYQLRASEAVTAKAAQGMPIDSRSAVSQANLGTLTLDGERLFEVALGGAGVAEGMLGYLAVDGVAYVGRVGADGKMTFDFGAAAPAAGTAAALTLVVPQGATNGNVRVVSPSVSGITYPDALVTEVVADTLYGDGFTSKSFGQYRIPSLVTDGAGEVLCLYDVRYGGGDLGTGDGIDIGETHSADGGRTFAKPRLAVDVPNTRDENQVSHGYAKTNDLGDVATLYDPATKTYWMMGMTGTGLYQGNYAMNDVVMYVRGKGAGAAWTPWRNPASTSDDPMAYRSIKETVMGQPGIKNASGGTGYGFLEGPGHGFVTAIGRDGAMPKGTLVFPTQYFVDSSLTKSTVGAIYSTDHGTNWIATARSTAGTNPQENCVMELDDGSWYMTTKAGSRPGTGRINFFRTTNYTNWVYVGEHYPVPCQQGSCLRLGKNATDGKGRYVLCHTLHPDTAKRERVALVFDTDTTAGGDAAGVSWDFANPLMLYYDSTGFKGYNSLCMVDANTLGVLYEAQGHIYFIRIDVGGRLR